MSDKISVKFNCEGDWSDHPADPIFHVEEGDVVEVSASLANVVVEAKKGKIVKKKEVVSEDDNKNNDKPEPKDGDACELKGGKEGVIKNGKCVKTGLLG